MVSNISNNENTLKSMLSVMNSDNYTIDKSILYCTYKNKDNIYQYTNILDNYRDYFEQYLVEMEVPKKFYYQPAAFAENYYGTADLDFLVLYFAKMTSLFEFTKPKIKVLPSSRLLEINRLFTEYKDEVKDSYNNPDEYVKPIL